MAEAWANYESGTVSRVSFQGAAPLELPKDLLPEIGSKAMNLSDVLEMKYEWLRERSGFRNIVWSEPPSPDDGPSSGAAAFTAANCILAAGASHCTRPLPGTESASAKRVFYRVIGDLDVYANGRLVESGESIYESIGAGLVLRFEAKPGTVGGLLDWWAVAF